MRYRLRENLFCCEVGQRVVFLDLAGDRYFRLSRRQERIFRRFLASGRVAEEDLELLMQDGTISLTAGEPARLPPLPPPRDLVVPACLRPRKREVARCLAARIRARWRLRRKGLLPLIDEIRLGSTRASQMDDGAEARLGALAAAFAESRTFLRSQDRCLAESLAMTGLCRREGVRVTLIFGVRLDPFAAHSWVQAGDVVITGDVDDARMCSPIMAVP